MTVRRNRAVKQPVFNEAKAEEILKLISKSEDIVIQHQTFVEQQKLELFDMLKEFGMKEFTSDVGVASIVNPIGRSSSFIDPRDYEKLVKKEEFYNSVKVIMEKAKMYISTLQLAKIKQVIPGEMKPETLVIEWKK